MRNERGESGPIHLRDDKRCPLLFRKDRTLPGARSSLNPPSRRPTLHPPGCINVKANYPREMNTSRFIFFLFFANETKESVGRRGIP
jgi:hypothetical protein